MVNHLREKINKLDSTFLWAIFALFIISLVMTWFMITYISNEIFQGILYPFSSYPVVVYTIGSVMVFPGWAIMWIATMVGINQILLELFEKPCFEKFKKKLGFSLVIMIVISIVSLLGDFVLWPIAAKANGYSPCPYDTLLFGGKISTAWSKKQAYCYDKGVQARLTSGTFDQVVQVAKYLDKN